MSTLAAGNVTTSMGRMAFAAAVLSTYASLAALIFTPRDLRSRLRCLLWGGVPLVVGAGNAVLVAGPLGAVAGLLSALPWLAGPLLAYALGLALPQLRRPRWLPGGSTTRSERA